MKLRPLRESDLAALLDLWNRSAFHDQMGAELAVEKIWKDAGFSPQLALVTEHNRQLSGFAMGVNRASDQGPRGFIKLIAVDPAHQRTGIGSHLLSILEARMRLQGALAIRPGESAPNYLVPGLDSRYVEARKFFEKHGYQVVGQASNLRVDLQAGDFSCHELLARLAGKGIEIRRASAADRENIMQFLRDHWPSWQAEVDLSMESPGPALHLAFRGNELLGFAAFDGNNVGTGWFGPMGTLEAARGMGIGRVLLRRCLSDLKAQGQTVATIPWVGPVGFYEQHAGAKPDREFVRYEKILHGH